MSRQLDFVHDQFARSRRFRILNIVDDVTWECLAAIPDTSGRSHPGSRRRPWMRRPVPRQPRNPERAWAPLPRGGVGLSNRDEGAQQAFGLKVSRGRRSEMRPRLAVRQNQGR
jgi:hypothetical protein